MYVKRDIHSIYSYEPICFVALHQQKSINGQEENQSVKYWASDKGNGTPILGFVVTLLWVYT